MCALTGECACKHDALRCNRGTKRLEAREAQASRDGECAAHAQTQHMASPADLLHGSLLKGAHTSSGGHACRLHGFIPGGPVSGEHRVHRTLSLSYDDLGALARTIAGSHNANSVDVIGDAMSSYVAPSQVRVYVWARARCVCVCVCVCVCAEAGECDGRAPITRLFVMLWWQCYARQSRAPLLTACARGRVLPAA